ncbi:uncharacterized protein LOC143202496 isoform X2 [Rhynchophorus ferrugineus]|uniref:uncharacterized protein LOC143202496 isoform X2 n=1 Tax=Rhynchophorus ferrugineus TaxID=354439 RepID=UPI003FCE3797
MKVILHRMWSILKVPSYITKQTRTSKFISKLCVVQLPLSPNISPAYLKSILEQQKQQNPLSQTRGPFDFIGQWIQQVPWLPVQVNVPDLFQNIGNGINQVGTTVSQFTQNVGNGVSTFGQNVGNGVNQFTQNIGNGWNQLSQNVGNGITTWVQNVPVIGNLVGGRKPTTGSQQFVLLPVEYPGGQQLVLANEALEAFP